MNSNEQRLKTKVQVDNGQRIFVTLFLQSKRLICLTSKPKSKVHCMLSKDYGRKVSSLSSYGAQKWLDHYCERRSPVAVKVLKEGLKALHEQCRKLVDIVVDVTIGEEQKWKM
ncbi:hypothetical protein T10_2219 [Trichinella papuae]|uniref:Uncharacterized protein n=1 Tax=Trichinella papuae TaxID=268474 RepID=A0A0V1MZG8_9BILA|nr:hypothetical protein T10_2219 [Trichinella papuae]